MSLRAARTRNAAAAAGLLAMLAAAVVSAAPAAAGIATGPGEVPGSDAALTTPFTLAEDRDVDDRLAQPEDRYAPAGGCYALRTGDGWVVRDGDAVATDGSRADALPLHLQPTELGRYLLVALEGPAEVEGADWDARSYLSAASPDPTGLLGDVLPASGLGLAAEPSFAGDWELVASGDDPEARDPRGQAYDLSLPDGPAGVGLEGVRLHLVDGCARWPEVATNTSGEPAPNPAGRAAPVKGFWESHVHGMAFEFLGGELRCGQPWHRWGVEHALPDCRGDDGQPLNGVLEVALAGESPESPVTTYDPVGWPTFASWPKHNTLTHEQWYWRWLERAHHGGLRVVSMLLVENTALCQLYPQKRNSCNEMDSIRLQAQRVFELQDYVDAQSGGPGEGWFRVVTTPAQARQVINDGRLAIVLGIETSELFDCRETVAGPQCDEESLRTSLREVADMGVRSLQFINKFDNALAGVTGDGGATGVLVNTGQLLTSGHFWDMRTCPEEIDSEGDGHTHEGDQHDKTQLNLGDDVAMGGSPDEVDVLAGVVVDLFGPAAAPVPAYPKGPHCNTRGLSDLGRFLLDEAVDLGMLFDPDHMSALAQREALDHLEDVTIPRLREQEGPDARIPGVLSSHSWGNDVIYQRIYDLDGVIGPRTAPADEFVQRWVERRDWHDEHAPPGAFFGLGYGADTNGLGAQPGPRTDPAEPVAYDGGWDAPLGDVRVFQQTSGVRTYDITVDGVAHYGLFADWFRELELSAEEQLGAGAARQLVRDMLNGPEDYLRTWERAVYGGGDCVTDGSSLQVDDLHALVGLDLEGFLRSVGQPVDRDDAAYVYCVDGQAVEVGFDEDGTATTVSPAPDRPLPVDALDDRVQGAPLPATGGGAAGLALALLGAAGLLVDRLRRA